MTLRREKSTDGKGIPEKMTWLLWLSLLVFFLVISGSMGCKRQGEETAAEEVEIIQFEGEAKAGVGQYLYVAETCGFDIVVQGQIDSGDTSALVGKEVKGEGEFSPDRPSILVADRIEVRESGRDWRTVFTRSEEPVRDISFDFKEREDFQSLKDLAYDKSEGWEGKERAKVFGRLEKETVTESGENKDIYRIVVLNEENKTIGRILVDNISDFAQYYIQKLRLFDNFWFYINVKETVDWSIRRRTSELFHADVLFAGLF